MLFKYFWRIDDMILKDFKFFVIVLPNYDYALFFCFTDKYVDTILSSV